MDLFKVKLVLLLAGFAFVIFLSVKDWQRNKIYAVYFLLILFALTGFSYDINKSFRTSFAEIVYILILTLMLVQWLSDKRQLPRIGIEKWVAFYLVVASIGVVNAFFNGIDPWNIAFEVKSYVIYIFFIYAVMYLVDSKKQIQSIMRVFAFLSIIPLIYILPNLQSIEHVADYGRSGIPNLTLEWGALNIFVGYALPVFFIIITLLRIEKRRFVKIVLLFLASIYLYTIFYSQTRTGWIALVSSLFVYSVLTKLQIKIWLIGGTLLIAALFAGQFSQIERVVKHRIVEQTLEKPDSSLENRFERWKTALANFKKSPLIGTGWGASYYITSRGKISDRSGKGMPVWHNTFFEILSQLGIIGVIAFYGIWYKLLRLTILIYRKLENLNDQMVFAGLLAASFSSFIFSFGEQQFYKIETASVSWFVIGCMLAHGKLAITEQYKENLWRYAAIKKRVAQ